MAARIAPGASTFLISLFIGRLGGAALLGLTQTITATAALASLLYPTPAGTNASRSISSSNAREDHVRAGEIARYLANRVLLASLILTIAVVTYTFIFHRPGIDVILVSGLMVVSVSLRAFTEGLHFGGGESQRLAAWSSAIAVLSLLTTTVLLLIGIRSVWVITPLVALNFVFVAFSWPGRTRKLRDRAVRTDISRFIRFAVMGTLASAGFTQLAVLLAASVNGLTYAGTYAASNTLTAPITMLASALGSVLFPALAAAHASGGLAELGSRLHRSTSLLATMILYACIPMLLLAAPIVHLLWGTPFADTAWIMLFSVPAVAVGAIASPAVSAITSESNRGMAISAISSAAGAAVGVIVWLCAIPFVPRLAIPLGYVIGIAIVAMIPWIIAWKKFSMRWTKESVTIISALSGAIVGAVILQQAAAPIWISALVALAAMTAWTVVRRHDVRRSVVMLRALRGS